jgi:hypothetical protein
MLKIVFLVPALVLLGLGLEGACHAYRSREVVQVTCAQLRQSRPASHNLRVTGCDIDYRGAAYRDSNGSIQELFFPARAAGAPVTQPAPLVVATRTPSVLAIASRVLGARASAEEQSVETIKMAARAAGVPGEIRGMVRAGLLERVASRKLFSGFSTPLSESVALLDLNAAPDFVWPAAMFGGGLLLLLSVVLLARRNSRAGSESVPDEGDRESVLERLRPYTERAAEPVDVRVESLIDLPLLFQSPPAPEPAGSVPVAEPSTRDILPAADRIRLPRVMLLRLGTSAGPDAIETAPPLGTKGDVTARLREVLPDLEIDQRGRGMHEGPDHAISVDLGPDETVHTAIIDARGETGIAAVRWVLETTGWRAFVPKAGRFVDPDAFDDLIIHDAASSHLR